MMQLSDTQLIDRILSGDDREYAILINRYKDLAFTIAFRILNNREDAEEVAQDAFVKAFRGLNGFRQDARFSTWLFRIVYNTALSKKRAKKHGFHWIDEVSLLNMIHSVTEQESNPFEEKELILEKAMHKLSEDERSILTLYYINESDIDDIHTITGLSKSNIKVKLFRARKKLQELIWSMPENAYI